MASPHIAGVFALDSLLLAHSNLIRRYVYILVVGFSAYLIWTGARMIINNEYTNYIAKSWFRSANDKEEKHHQYLVKIINGPGYILFGLVFLAYGLWQLDVDYGILDNFSILRSIIQ